MSQIGIKLMAANRIGRVKVAMNLLTFLHFTNGKSAGCNN